MTSLEDDRQFRRHGSACEEGTMSDDNDPDDVRPDDASVDIDEDRS
ncbi:hypothetical protein GUG94_06290, partial [Xanthomonas citri pv. citri]|nr:hypothetical protein [Xanthomonas citri pv. citri]